MHSDYLYPKSWYNDFINEDPPEDNLNLKPPQIHAISFRRNEISNKRTEGNNIDSSNRVSNLQLVEYLEEYLTNIALEACEIYFQENRALSGETNKFNEDRKTDGRANTNKRDPKEDKTNESKEKDKEQKEANLQEKPKVNRKLSRETLKKGDGQKMFAFRKYEKNKDDFLGKDNENKTDIIEKDNEMKDNLLEHDDINQTEEKDTNKETNQTEKDETKNLFEGKETNRTEEDETKNNLTEGKEKNENNLIEIEVKEEVVPREKHVHFEDATMRPNKIRKLSFVSKIKSKKKRAKKRNREHYVGYIVENNILIKSWKGPDKINYKPALVSPNSSIRDPMLYRDVRSKSKLMGPLHFYEHTISPFKEIGRQKLHWSIDTRLLYLYVSNTFRAYYEQQ